MAAKSSDWYVRMGSKKTPPGTAEKPVPYIAGLPGSYRGPSGSVPPYIASDPRFYVSVGNSSTDTSLGFIPPADYYGTKTDKPAWMYPEDGRYVKGPYAGHESGDIGSPTPP